MSTPVFSGNEASTRKGKLTIRLRGKSILWPIGRFSLIVKGRSCRTALSFSKARSALLVHLIDQDFPSLEFHHFFGTFFFGLPICGLRQLLAARFDAENELNPTSDTRSLFFSAFAVFAVKKSSALEAPDMEITASFAIVVIKFCLFMAATGAAERTIAPTVRPAATSVLSENLIILIFLCLNSISLLSHMT
jgi:hypothetical protein